MVQHHQVEAKLFKRDDLTYWQTPPHCQGADMEVDKLVLPKKRRQEHGAPIGSEAPLAGHKERRKMVQDVFQHIYWPTVYRNMAELCTSFPRCHKVAIHKVPQAPLSPCQ